MCHGSLNDRSSHTTLPRDHCEHGLPCNSLLSNLCGNRGCLPFKLSKQAARKQSVVRAAVPLWNCPGISVHRPFRK